MEVLLTLPRSGSHVFGQMMNFKMIVTFRKGQSKPEDLPMEKDKVLNILHSFKPNGKYWLHLPYEEDYREFVEMCERKFLLLRDPRDVIVSCVHVIDKMSIGLNYRLESGRPLSSLPMTKRVDFLIDTMRPLFDWYDNWRKCGWKIFYYEDLINSPKQTFKSISDLGYGDVEEIKDRAAYKNPRHFHKGIVGAWKEEFSPTQQRKAEKEFGDIIESWKSK